MEGTLSEEERTRNGRRLDRLYVSTSHAVAPDIFELGDLAAAAAAEGNGNAAVERALDPKITGSAPKRMLGCRLSLIVRSQPVSAPPLQALSGLACISLHCRVAETALDEPCRRQTWVTIHINPPVLRQNTQRHCRCTSYSLHLKCVNILLTGRCLDPMTGGMCGCTPCRLQPDAVNQ